MPYPFYNGYNAYQSPYQNLYQQNYQPMQPAPVQPTPQHQNPPTTIMWVNNEREAAMYPILPNSAVALWDESQPVVYLKQADASGKPTMKTFDLVERTAAISETSAPSEKSIDYATKDDVRTIAAVLDGMNGSFESMRGEIETMKGDLYGIAGKKKPTKKVDSESDE